MTDNEIIKALELHSAPQDACVNKCPYGKERYCGSKMAKDALDLINRQSEKIEDLKVINEHLNVFVFEVREAAIKEFAGKIKEELDDFYYSNEDALLETADLIDDLVKEMTEGK